MRLNQMLIAFFGFLFLVGSLAMLLSHFGVIETTTKQVFYSFFEFHSLTDPSDTTRVDPFGATKNLLHNCNNVDGL